MIGVSVKSNLDRAIAEFSAYTENVPKATVRALNRALDQSATGASREIRKVYNVKAAAITRAMKKLRAREKSLYPSAVLELTGARLGLIEFAPRERVVKSARGKRRGVSVQVLTRGERKLVSGGFVGTNRASGYRGIFKRVGAARYPIKNLRSISLPRAFTVDVVQKAIRAIAIESFDKNFRQQIRFLGRSR